MKFKIELNAPITLGFIGLALVIQVITQIIPNFTEAFFTLGGSVNVANPLDIFRLFSHVLGHANFEHLFNNSVFLLLLGPILEEKYGNRQILFVIIITAFVTGIINVLFFSTGLLGASGVVFAFIILSSIVNVKSGSLPLSFILVFVLYVGKEMVHAMSQDQISQMAHIVGGIIGAMLGFRMRKS